MAKANPNRQRIPDAIWNLAQDFLAYEKTAVLSGIFALKDGYHNAPINLRVNDYSLKDVAADRLGSRQFAAALDVSMPTAQMRKYTKRLVDAAQRRDPRLYPPGKPPVLREIIGTLDGKTVTCYMLVGGVPQGVGADAGFDYGRDKTHLWHLHLSIIRLYADDDDALAGVLSILKGEPMSKPLTEDTIVRYKTDGTVKYSTTSSKILDYFTSLHYYVMTVRNAVAAGFAEVVGELRKPLPDSDVERIAEAVAAKLRPQD